MYETTAGEVRRLCQGLSVRQWNVPLGVVLTEDEPAYPGYDEKLWSQLPRPEPTGLVAALSGLRAYNTALLRHTPRGLWQRWGTHGEQGRDQFGLMIAKIAGHDLAHLNQLARTVAVAARQDDSTEANGSGR